MDERMLVARLHRRAGFGLDGAGLDEAAARGAATEAARLARPDAVGLPPAADPFVGLDLSGATGTRAEHLAVAVDAWLTRMLTTPRPGIERLAWFWHGHFVAAAPKVKVPAHLAGLLRTIWAAATGPFDALVRAVTVEPAMLVYLDGSGSAGAGPNENYARELMELFTLGRTGGYTEADVQTAARALTGWRVGPRDEAGGAATFVARRHDDTPGTLLGLGGVHDVDTVVRAVTGHPSCAAFVAGEVARAVIGPGVDAAVVASLTERFRSSGLDVGVLWEATLAALAGGADGGPIVLAPVPWLVMAERACGVSLPAKTRLAGLRAAGQVPFAAPNVAGWPSGEAWFSSATVVARANVAVALAVATPGSSPLASAATTADPGALATALGLGEPLGDETMHAVRAERRAAGRVVAALTSPEFVLA